MAPGTSDEMEDLVSQFVFALLFPPPVRGGRCAFEVGLRILAMSADGDDVKMLVDFLAKPKATRADERAAIECAELIKVRARRRLILADLETDEIPPDRNGPVAASEEPNQIMRADRPPAATTKSPLDEVNILVREFIAEFLRSQQGDNPLEPDYPPSQSGDSPCFPIHHQQDASMASIHGAAGEDDAKAPGAQSERKNDRGPWHRG